MAVATVKAAATVRTSVKHATASKSRAFAAFSAYAMAVLNAIEFWLELCTEFFLKRLAFGLVRYRKKRPVREYLVRVFARVFGYAEQAVPALADIDKLFILVQEVHAGA